MRTPWSLKKYCNPDLFVKVITETHELKIYECIGKFAMPSFAKFRLILQFQAIRLALSRNPSSVCYALAQGSTRALPHKKYFTENITSSRVGTKHPTRLSPVHLAKLKYTTKNSARKPVENKLQGAQKFLTTYADVP